MRMSFLTSPASRSFFRQGGLLEMSTSSQPEALPSAIVAPRGQDREATLIVSMFRLLVLDAVFCLRRQLRDVDGMADTFGQIGGF
jgi:hypothetical protein